MFRDDCTDETTLFIYVVTTQKNLYRFDPIGGDFRFVGEIDCAPGQRAFSMAVSREGTAVVSMAQASSGSSPRTATLWRVSTVDASCEAIPQYVPGQMGFALFGMGFATDEGGPDETLYIGGSGYEDGATGLARLDTTSFEVSFIGDNDPPGVGVELTGSGDGRLFAFFSRGSEATGIFADRLGELDKANGAILWEMPIPGVEGGQGWAMAHWGGDFYFFTSPGSDASATRFRLDDGSTEVVAWLPQEAIVGAGVTTCARLK